jgi:hypothetical protein
MKTGSKHKQEAYLPNWQQKVMKTETQKIETTEWSPGSSRVTKTISTRRVAVWSPKATK